MQKIHINGTKQFSLVIFWIYVIGSIKKFLNCNFSDWPRACASYHEVCSGGTAESYCSWTGQFHCRFATYCWDIQTKVPVFCEEHWGNGPAVWSVILSTCSIRKSSLTVEHIVLSITTPTESLVVFPKVTAIEVMSFAARNFYLWGTLCEFHLRSLGWFLLLSVRHCHHSICKCIIATLYLILPN